MSKEEIIKGLESVKIECGKHLDESFAWICEPIDKAIELINNEELDQENIFKQLEAEIDWGKDWLAYTGYKSCYVSVAFDSIKHILDKAISTIDKEKNWLSQAGYNAQNVDIAFSNIEHSLRKCEGRKTT